MLGTAVFDTPGVRVAWAPMRPPQAAADIGDAGAGFDAAQRLTHPDPQGARRPPPRVRCIEGRWPIRLGTPDVQGGRDMPPPMNAATGSLPPSPVSERTKPGAGKRAATPGGPSTGRAGLLSWLSRPARSPSPNDRPHRHPCAIRAGEPA